MGDAFRGLTIRLGADSTGLKKALNSITTSTREAQAQLKKVQSALKVDGSNAEAMARSFELARDKMGLTAKSAETLKTAIAQTSQKTKDFAANTSNIYSKINGMRDAYNNVDKNLDIIDKDMARIVEKQDKIKFTKALKAVQELRAALSGTGPAADEARAKIEQYLSLVARKNNPGLTFEQAQEEARKLIARYDELRAQHNKYAAELKKLNGAAGFLAAKDELISFNAKLQEAAMQTARLRAEFHAIGGGSLSDAVAKARSLDSVIDELKADTVSMNEAARLMPSNYHAAAAKARTLAATVAALKQKESALSDVLKKIESTPGFDRQKAKTKDMAAAAEQATRAFADITTEVSKAENKLEKMKQVQAKLEADGKKESNYYKNVKNAIEKCNSELAELKNRQKAADGVMKENVMYRTYQRVDGMLIKVQGDITRVTAQTSKLETMTRAFNRLRSVGYGMAKSLSAGIMVAGQYVIRAAEEIDSAYRDMRKTVNGTEEDFEHLKEAAIEYSKAHVTSADTILEIEAMGGQLGIAVDNLESFARTVSNLDIATNMDSDQIAEQLGKMASVIKINVDEYDNFGDALVRLGNNMPVMEGDIMTVTTRFMGMGKVVGMTADEMLGWATAASATGQKSEAAGSSLMRFISNMETAVNGSDEALEEWAQIAGMSAEEFRDAFETSASGAMYKFIEGLGDMQRNGDSVNQVLTKLGIRNVRDKQLLEGLANQMANGTEESNLLKNALEMSYDAYHGLATQLDDGTWERAGDAAREADKKAEGFSGSLSKAANSLKALASEIGESAAPIIKQFSELFDDLGKTLKSISPEAKTFVLSLVGAVGAGGYAAAGLGSLGQAIGDIGKTIMKYKDMRIAEHFFSGFFEAEEAAKKADKLKGALGKLTWGKLAVGAAAFAALAAAVKFAWDKYQVWNDSQNKFLEMASGSMPQVGAWGREFEKLGSGIDTARFSYDKFLESHANTAKAIQQRNKEAQTEIDKLEAAKQAIKKYGGQSDLTAQQLGELSAAIEVVNEMCGTQLQLAGGASGAIRDENGAMQDATKIIDDYIAAKQRQIEQEALSNDYYDLMADRAERVKELARLQSDIAEREEMKEALGYKWDEASEAALEETKRQAEEVAKAIDDDTTAIENCAYRLGELASGAKVLSDVWQAVFEGSTGDTTNTFFRNFGEAAKNLGVDIDTLNNLSYEKIKQIVDDWTKGGKTISEALARAGVETRTFTDVLGENMGKADVSLGDLAESFGVNMDVLAGKMHAAGISADASWGSMKDSIAQAIEESDGNIDTFVQKLAEMTGTKVTVTASYDSEGADQAQQDMENIDESEATAKINADNAGADDKIDDTESRLNSYDNSTYTATADLDTSPATTALSTLLSKLESYGNLHITADAEISGGQAAGGTYSNLIRAVPRNAKGAALNGIVTRATLTNVGLVGEAGDEALLHMRNAGGAIIPLSNRQHVRPFARAVAAEMPYSASNTSVTNIYIDGAQINARPEMEAEFYRCMQDLRRMVG